MSPWILTLSERAALHDLSIADEMALEREQPWIKSWAARHGAGTANLKAWLRAGRPRAARGALAIGGDRALVDAARTAFATIPDPVAWLAVGTALVRCGNGREALGRASAPRLPCAHPVLVELYTDSAGVLGHELGHLWAASWLPPECRLDDTQRAAVRAAIVDLGLAESVVEEEFLHEQAADALARLWGFPIDTTSGNRGELRRRRLRQDIQRAAERARSNLKETPSMTTSTDENEHTEQPPADEERAEPTHAADDEPTAEGLICDVSICDEDGNFPALAE